jgi:hypothetical protein
MFSLAALLLSNPALADHPPGATLPDAVAVDISDEGLDAFLPVAESLIPTEFDIPPVAGGDDSGIYEYSYSLTNGWVSVTINDADITPQQDILQVDANLTVQVNQPSDPALVDLEGEIVWVLSVGLDCDAWVDPFDVQVDTGISLTFDPATGTATAALLPLNYSYTLTSDNINIDGCALETIDDILSAIGVDIFETILDAVEPEIDGAIAGLTDDLDLNTPINDALASATLQEVIDLQGVPLTVDVAPSDIEIAPTGVRIALDGSISAPADPCVEPYGITGSLETPSILPAIGDLPGGLPFTPHVGVYADDDLVNQGLFAVWNAGLLCQTIDDSTGDLPIGIDTNLLGLLAPGVYDELFPEPQPIRIITRPSTPPVGSVVGPSDINIDVQDLGTDFYGELEGRQARLMRVDLDAEAGIDLDFDGTTGALAVLVGFGGENITAEVSYNELTPDSNDQIADQLVGIVDQLVGPLLGSALQDLAFDIPSFEGFGLQEVTIAPAASTGDRLGVYGAIGPVPYQSAGCGDGSGGCDAGAGCEDTGCSSGRVPVRVAFIGFALLLAGLRRRRD